MQNKKGIVTRTIVGTAFDYGASVPVVGGDHPFVYLRVLCGL
ncbi:MAG: hypothetical protein WB558_22295 [Terriglobales bacterium]